MVVTLIKCDVFLFQQRHSLIFLWLQCWCRTGQTLLDLRANLFERSIFLPSFWRPSMRGKDTLAAVRVLRGNFVQWGIHFSSEKENCNERQDNLLMRTVIAPNLGWCKLVFTWLLGLFLSCILRLRVKGKVVWIIQFYKICFSGWLIKVSIDWMMNNKG